MDVCSISTPTFRPLLAYLFFSHKILRWFSPHIMILLVAVNIPLAFYHPVYIVSLSLALGSFLLSLTRIVPGSYYLLSMNTAMLKGFFLSFRREKSGGWTREARSDE